MRNDDRRLFFAKVRGVLTSNRFREKRQRWALAAFDQALVHCTKSAPGVELNPSMEVGLLAVKANTFQCGPMARAAEKWLAQQSVRGFRFHSLKGHYVLLDTTTGLLHDIEVPFGVKSKQELPLLFRENELHSIAIDAAYGPKVDSIFEKYAAQWLLQRRILFQRFLADSTTA